ncbi:MAG: FAD-dependent oxidoreductase [Phycisphaerales bacterium]|nr:FAD-dependent oxidoreductase [Phycisphaerales bacterium]
MRGACDVVIVGGGVAGLWSAVELGRGGVGFGVVLVEAGELGGAQTIASQGIIHGGIKYALGESVGDASRVIAGMPARWRASLRGEVAPDLRGVRVLSESQVLWTRPGIASRVAGVAASAVIRTEVKRLGREDVAGALAGAPRGRWGGGGIDVYRVDEQVLEPRSLVAALAARAREARVRLVRGEMVEVEQGGTSGARVRMTVRGAMMEIEASAVVLAAGAGNEALVAGAWRESTAAAQLRPLHMVMARAARGEAELPEVWGHCIGSSSLPLLTISSQRGGDGRVVWYMGGALAEEGVARSEAEQRKAALAAIRACLPWLRLERLELATLRIDRAEARTGDGRRPEGPVVVRVGNVIAAWPTKLAFAPVVADRVMEEVRAIVGAGGGRGGAASGVGVSLPADLPEPEVAPLPWDREGVEWSGA